MNDQFTKPFADLFKGQFPNQLQTAVQDGLAKTREMTIQSIAAAKDGAEALGKASPVASKETGALTSKAFEQVLENTEAAYAAAQSIFRAQSPIEAAQLQAKYMQAQFARAGEQFKELFELSTKVAQKSAEGVSQLNVKSAAAFKA